MSNIADVLRPNWLPGLADISGRTTTALKGWLTERHYVFDSHAVATGWKFYTTDLDGLLRAIAFDVNRMSCASFESIYGVIGGREIQRSSAWMLIRAYYSAFFAAHAIGRIFSESYTQIDRTQATAINLEIPTTGTVPQITDGLHLITALPASQEFVIRRINRHGVHEDIWTAFGALLQRLSAQALVSPYPNAADRQQVSSFIDDTIGIMQTDPAFTRSSWLSYMRNSINYQHQHGTWFPHERSGTFRQEISDNFSKWTKDPSIVHARNEHTLSRFSLGCTALVAMNRDLVEDMKDRNSDNDSFLDYAAAPVLEQTR